MLSVPSSKNRRHCGHKGLPRRKTQDARGKSRQKASTQRSKLSVMGEIRPPIMRPTTALPDHSRGASVSKRTERSESVGSRAMAAL